MDTIEERAQMCVDKIGILGAYQGYINGATEQKKIDDEENLQDLTWQDIKRIVEIADDIADFDTYRNRHTGEEDYYNEVLRRFKEGK